MKNRTLLVLLLFSIASFGLLSSCNPLSLTLSPDSIGTNTPLPSSTFTPEIPTATSTSTRTPLPTSTRTPTITPTFTATLAPEGPYLILDASPLRNNESIFVITNANGEGRKEINLPEMGYVGWGLQEAISPDGKWIAYHTGTYGAPYDLTLHLFNIADNSTIRIASLLSDNYPDILSEVVEALGGPTENINMTTVEWALHDGIDVVAWSPDNRYLAFAGQIDGPSSDLYLFDVTSLSYRRLTDDPQNIGSITWSPDGQWILYENTIPGSIYMGSSLHAIRPESEMVLNPMELESGFWWRGQGWLSETEYLITGQGDGGDPYDLHTVNIQTGQITSIWRDLYFAYAYDPENQLFILAGAPNELQPENGDFMVVKSYLLSSTGSRHMIDQDLPWGLIFRGGETTRFIGFDTNGILAIDKGGNINVISKWNNASGSVSPDYQWLVVYKDAGFQLFDNNDVLVLENREISVSDIFWRPDSQGFFIMSNGILYFMDILTQEPVLVDICNGIPECWVSTSYLAWSP